MEWLAWLRKLRGLQPSAMKQFAIRLVHSPKYADQMSEALERRSQLIDEANAAPPPDESTIRELVELLMDDDELVQKIALIRLEKAERRAIPALLDALDSPRCVMKPCDGMEGSPGTRVADLLWRLDCPELGHKLSKLVDDNEWRIYSTAIRACVALGSKEAAALAIRKLSGDESIASEAAENGVEAAIRRGVASPEFLEAILAWAEQSTVDPAQPPSKWAVAFFANRGGQRALDMLTSERLLSLENNHNIHFVLETLDRLRVDVDPTLLEAMLTKSQQSVGNWPWEYVFKRALAAIARHDPDRARVIADQALSSDSETHLNAAIEFLRRHDQLPRSWQSDPPPGLELSPDEQRLVDLLDIVCECTGQIGNGGLSQYFFNSSGDRWPRAVEALRAIGDDHGAEMLLKAAHMVAPGGASTDRDTRIEQYAALSEETEQELDKLSPVFWSSRMELIELRFMQRHKELFQSIRRARAEAGMDREK
jgi:HEAT repeat protein